MGEIIDWHSHWISRAELDLLSERKALPRVTWNEAGQPLLEAPEAGIGPSKSAPFALSGKMTDIEERLRHLDEVGIARQVISALAFAYEFALSPEEARPFIQTANNELSALVHKHPDRFSGLAALATSDPEWSAGELERAHNELGLIGAVLPTNAFATLEGAHVLAPIFAAAQKLRSHIFLHRGAAHPSVPGQPPIIIPEDTAPARWGLLIDTHLAAGAITLGLSDFLDPYPDVTIQLAMLGGSIGYVIEHIEMLSAHVDFMRGKASNGSRSATGKLRRLYFDPGPYSLSPRSVELTARTFGADRLLFGSDYGPMPDIGLQLTKLKEAYTPQLQRLVYVENGRRLLAEKGVAA
jgi:predicted TIM-barrel fold metal-dependent hydrolase